MKVEIEKTSKKLKLQLLLSKGLIALAAFVVGPIAAFASYDSRSDAGIAITAITLGAGIVWYIVTKIRIWWQHG